MGREEIVVLIGPEGSVKIEVTGVEGPRCEALTRNLERSLGSVFEREKKTEYFQREKVRHRRPQTR